MLDKTKVSRMVKTYILSFMTPPLLFYQAYAKNIRVPRVNLNFGDNLPPLLITTDKLICNSKVNSNNIPVVLVECEFLIDPIGSSYNF